MKFQFDTYMYSIQKWMEKAWGILSCDLVVVQMSYITELHICCCHVCPLVSGRCGDIVIICTGSKRYLPSLQASLISFYLDGHS